MNQKKNKIKLFLYYPKVSQGHLSKKKNLGINQVNMQCHAGIMAPKICCFIINLIYIYFVYSYSYIYI